MGQPPRSLAMDITKFFSGKPLQSVSLIPNEPADDADPKDLLCRAKAEMGIDSDNFFNFAVCGLNSAAKSTFISRFLDLKGNGTGQEAVEESTHRIRRYKNDTLPYLILWDIPAASTSRNPKSFFMDNRLYSFDCILILSNGRFLEMEIQIAEHARKWGKNCAMIRTKADAEIKTFAEQSKLNMAEAANQVRKQISKSFEQQIRHRSACLFIISSRALNSDSAYFLKEDHSLALMDERKLIEFLYSSIKSRIGIELSMQPSHRINTATTNSTVTAQILPGLKAFLPFQLRNATANYNEKMILGQNSDYVMYKGVLSDGKTVAIKRWDPSINYEQNLGLFEKINHPSLVNILGHCNEERVTVEEYMEKGSLGDPQYGLNADGKAKMKTICEIAKGLDYLHSNRMMHGDLKAENVMVDAEMNAKVSCFGKCCRAEKYDADVCAFGRLVVWILSGKQRAPPDPKQCFGADTPHRDVLVEALQLGVKCVKEKPSMRTIATRMDRLYDMVLSDPPPTIPPLPNPTTPPPQKLKKYASSKRITAS